MCVRVYVRVYVRVNVYQDPDAHEEMVDELGLMLTERRRCSKVTLEHMPLHQTNGACMYVFKPATSAVQAALLTHISQAADCQRLTSETAQLKSLLGAVQTVLQFLDLRKREEEKEEEKEKEEEGIEEIRGREEEGGRRKRVAAVDERG